MAALIALVSAAFLARAGDLPASADPAAGGVADGVYRNAYFGIEYRLPPDWRAGVEGPAPSERGYYVLASFVPSGAVSATLLIAAQDLFFAARPVADDAEMVRRFSATLGATDGMAIDRAPTELTIAGHRFSRIDFSSVGLHRALLVTQLRCHLVSFNLAASDPTRLAALAQSLDALAIATDDDRTPLCLKDYASGDNLLRRVEPGAVGPSFTAIPVRIVIGEDGVVQHVHVIRAVPAQRDAIAAALAQWRFKPYDASGVSRAVETGLLFSFKAAEAAAH